MDLHARSGVDICREIVFLRIFDQSHKDEAVLEPRFPHALHLLGVEDTIDVADPDSNNIRLGPHHFETNIDEKIEALPMVGIARAQDDAGICR
jgi:hypothetical protein